MCVQKPHHTSVAKPYFRALLLRSAGNVVRWTPATGPPPLSQELLMPSGSQLSLCNRKSLMQGSQPSVSPILRTASCCALHHASSFVGRPTEPTVRAAHGRSSASRRRSSSSHRRSSSSRRRSSSAAQSNALPALSQERRPGPEATLPRAVSVQWP